MLAYHSDPKIKADILTQLRTHAEADEIVKGQYWHRGKGCAVGCTIHSNNHAEYEPRFGIPQMLARLEDVLFEGLPNDRAKEWPIRFMSAIEPGKDLSLVGWKFLRLLLTDETLNPGITNPALKGAIKQCADVLVPLTKGEPVDESAASAARSAAWSAASAESAAWSAASAVSAAWSAASAESAAWSAAWSAESAAWSVAWIAESAAWSVAWIAESAAWSAVYTRMSNKLIELIESAS